MSALALADEIEEFSSLAHADPMIERVALHAPHPTVEDGSRVAAVSLFLNDHDSKEIIDTQQCCSHCEKYDCKVK